MTDWPQKPFGELVDNFDSIRVPVKEADRRPGPYPYYGASGIVDRVDGYLFDGEYLLVAEDGENLRTRQTPIAFIATGKFWVNNHAHIVRANGDNVTRYLMYAMRQAEVSAYLTGSTMPKLTQGNMNRVPVVAPPRAIQETIAHILGTLDDKIELNRRMNETLEAMVRALFKSWFVDFDPVRAKAQRQAPPGMDPATAALFPSEFQDSELGEIPKGWRVSPIGDVVNVCGGSTPPTKEPKYWDGGIHCWATPKDLSGKQAPVLLDTDRRITDGGLAQISSGLLPAGTLLLSSRAPIGYVAISQVPVAVNQGFIAMPPGGAVGSAFLLFWVHFNMDQILARAGGTTFQEISKRNFRPIPLAVPDGGVLAQFSEVAEPILQRIVGNERESRALARIRDLLLPRLLSGELSVAQTEHAMEATA